MEVPDTPTTIIVTAEANKMPMKITEPAVMDMAAITTATVIMKTGSARATATGGIKLKTKYPAGSAMTKRNAAAVWTEEWARTGDAARKAMPVPMNVSGKISM